MRTSGIASERRLTTVVYLIAIGFFVILAGGPGQFLQAIEKTLQFLAVTVSHFAQGLHW